jgi:hypothetical protein
MQSQPHLSARPVEPGDKPTRRAYAPPVLRAYGTVQALTQGVRGSMTNRDGGNTQTRSDRSLKAGIVRVGTHPLGIGLYLFDYKPEFQALAGFGRQFGVMADEVESVMPQAVGRTAQGHKAVDYAMLGISRPGRTH